MPDPLYFIVMEAGIPGILSRARKQAAIEWPELNILLAGRWNLTGGTSDKKYDPDVLPMVIFALFPHFPRVHFDLVSHGSLSDC